MNTRIFGRTGRVAGEIGLGTWQLGGGWGTVSDDDALATLRAAFDSGTNFFDTADVYGAGRSESLIGRFLRETRSRDEVFIVTKLGRRGDPGWPHNFTRDVVRKHTEESLQRLGVEAVDLTQLHCVPPDVLRRGELFGWLEELKCEGKVKAYGASVEAMDEALWCCAQPGCSALQIIFNIFRQKPIHTLFSTARRGGIALIVRLPLASGLLGGRMTKQTTFAADDHRNFNRDGAAFNVGETFAGLPFEKGVELADLIAPMIPPGLSMAEFAIRWCLDFEAISVVIPGARNADQARANIRPTHLAPLGAQRHVELTAFYERQVASHIRGPY
ncbi:MAG TPA: aldo/keto reductase [Candidatus Didemnitutus sp.]|jgi:aryl-alcohol dehydrogenase-like predicted oxidoreductase